MLVLTYHVSKCSYFKQDILTVRLHIMAMAGKVRESYIQVRESDGKVRESDILPRILRSVLTCETHAVFALRQIHQF